MINKINNFQKGLFIILSTFSLIFLHYSNLANNLNNQIYLLFFLVSLIGIPHGFFDFSIGKIIFKKYARFWSLYFVTIYIFITFAYFIAWFIIPGISLIFFLFIAAYHFGFEDYNYFKNGKTIYININIFIKGLIIVFTPILFHFDNVNYLFYLLIGYGVSGIEFSLTQKTLFIFLSISHIIFEKDKNYLHKFEGLFCFGNFILLPPLISFTLYFCFLHSARHFIESIYITKLMPDNFTIKGFLIFIIICSLFFSLASVTLISNIYEMSINETIIKYIFIILACLTLPHMIFNMWPYDKNN